MSISDSDIAQYYSDDDSTMDGRYTSKENLYEDDKKLDNATSDTTPGRAKLRSWLNKVFRIVMSDGRTLVGDFLCTDGDANVILGVCSEVKDDSERFLGLVMVPGRHIVSMKVDVTYKAGDLSSKNKIKVSWVLLFIPLTFF